MKANLKTIFLASAILALKANLLLAQNPSPTVFYTATTETTPNPERGWFVFYELKPTYFNNSNNWATEKLLDDYFKKGYRMIKHITLLPTVTGKLPQTYLDQLQAEADLVRKKGMKVFYRFAYNWNHSISRADADEENAKIHLDQLKPFFTNNKDIIAWLEMGFIGNWGEMHTSFIGHNVPQTVGLTQSGKNIVLKVLEVLPKDRFLCVRYPVVLYRNPSSYGSFGFTTPLNTTTAYSGSNQSRLGSWYANFGAGDILSYKVPEHKDNWSPETRYLPMSAHCDHFEDISLEPSDWLKEAETFHYVALSNPNVEAHTQDIYQKWVDAGAYQKFENQLGYRFRLAQASIANTTLKVKDTLVLTMTMYNDGWARPVNPRDIELVIRNKTTKQKYILPVVHANPQENRLWLPGGLENAVLVAKAQLPAGMKDGNYDVLLNLPDRMPSIHTRPEYSIRLANKDILEDSTGYNKLNMTIAVNGVLSLENIEVNNLVFSLHPNPAKTELFVSGNLVNNSNYEITSIEGKALQAGVVNSGSINIENLKTGIYIIKIKTEAGERVQRFVKE